MIFIFAIIGINLKFNHRYIVYACKSDSFGFKIIAVCVIENNTVNLERKWMDNCPFIFKQNARFSETQSLVLDSESQLRLKTTHV